MCLKNRFMLTAIILSASLCISANPDPKFHIYISIGQSNMEGQGTIEMADLTGISQRFLTLAAADFPVRNRARGEWYPAVPPICREDLVTTSPTNRGLGPTDYFGRTMVEGTPEDTRIGVICVAVGAAKIEGFSNDIVEAQDYYNYQCKDYVREKFAIYDYYGYGHVLALARQAQKTGVIRGILLHQGESNYGQNDWPLKVKAFYESLLSDLNLQADQVPLLVGEVTEKGPSASMNSIIRTIPKYIPTAYVISSAGVAEKSNDKIHFSAEGYREMGRRYAAKMLELEGYTRSLPPQLSTAKDYLTYSTAPSIVRLALQNAIQQAESGNSSRQNLETAIRNYTCSSAKPMVGHPFDMTWVASINPSAFIGMTGTYQYSRLGPVAEFYVSRTDIKGVIMHQTIRNLPSGIYDVVVQASSSYTSGRGFQSPVSTESGNERTYVYANQVSKMVPVHDVGSTLIYEPLTYIIKGVIVDDGNLDIGIRHDASGANWDLLRIHHIARVATVDENTTEPRLLKETLSRANLFASSSTLPQAFVNILQKTSTLHELQEAIEQASQISIASREYLKTRAEAQSLADVPYNSAQGDSFRYQFEQRLLKADSLFDGATTAKAVKDINNCLLHDMYDYVSCVSPASGYQFDLTYMIPCPDLTPFMSGILPQGWITEQPSGTLKVCSDASVISEGGLQTFCEYLSGATTSLGAFAVCQAITLPPGNYKLTALAFAETGQRTVRPIVSLRADSINGTSIFSSTLSPAYVQFELNEEETVKFGLYAYEGNQATRMGIGYLQLVKVANSPSTDIPDVSLHTQLRFAAKSQSGKFVTSDSVYNLQGQMIAERLSTIHGFRGIAVVNGKKILIK